MTGDGATVPGTTGSGAGAGDVLIRPALVADAEAIAVVQVQSWQESYPGIVPAAVLGRLSVARRAAGIAARLADPTEPTATFVAAEAGGGVVGFGVCGPVRVGPAGYRGEIHALYLLDRVKRRGIGRRIMGRLAAWLATRELSPALVWVLAGNGAARAFYERLGGVPVGERLLEMDGASLPEACYGWPSLTPLLVGGPPAAEIVPFPQPGRLDDR